MLCVQLMIGYTSLRPTVTSRCGKEGHCDDGPAIDSIFQAVVVMGLVHNSTGKLQLRRALANIKLLYLDMT